MASSLAAVQHMKLLTKISDPAVQAEVVDEAIVWSIQHGLVMGLGGDAPPGSVSHAPLALLPMPYPRDAFERAQRAALAFSSMIDRVSRDEPYLEATLRPAAAHDPFTARLLQLLVETRPQRSARPTRVLSVLRSDYMLHEDDSLLQVELNTIASSFASLSSLTSRLHHSVLDRLGAGAFDLQALPHNDAMDGIAKALGSAHMHYVSGRPQLAPAKASDAQEAPVASSADAGGRGAGPLVSEGLSGGARSEGCSHSAGGSSTGRGGGAGGITLARTFAPQVHPTPGAALAAPPEPRASKPVILFVVQPGERNAVDQHWLRSRLWDLHRVRVARLTLEEVAERCSLRESPKGASPAEQELWIDAQGARPRRVSVVYLRAGYAPDDYVSDRCWAARALLERSAAFLCPTAALQLAGAKRVQQDLSAPGVVERFSATDAEARALRSFFAEQWSLEGLGRAEEGYGARAEALARALDSPQDWVLKPQREGGGNNFYGEALRERLGRGDQGLAAYVLMQRIKPPVQRALLVRAGRALEEDTLSELGVYSAMVRDGTTVHHHRQVGHLVRTKAADSDEGGVAAGFSVIDSPLLVRGAVARAAQEED